MKPRVSIVIPAYNEGSDIEDVLSRLIEAVQLPSEIVVVVDAPDDTTVPYVEKYAPEDPHIRSWSTTCSRGRPRPSATGSTGPWPTWL